jgi:glycosyltransferase involved in cell wall biosynthesis
VSYLPNKKYDLVVDNHNTIERLYSYFSDTIKILHISSAHWLYQNAREIERLQAIQLTKSRVIKPTRMLEPSASIELCDFATCLGNQFTAQTYAFAQKKIHFIPVTSTVYFDKKPQRDYNKVKHNFFWFGSKGFALKGLDIVLEAFAKMPQYNLTICAPLDTEKEFCEVFKKELFETDNIHTIGWVDVRGDKFVEIMEQNAAIVSLSFSEGGGASVITCMHGGLIPIVSKSNSVDIYDFGFMTDEISVSQLIKTLHEFTSLDNEILVDMSQKAYLYARENHNMAKFSEKMSNIFVSLNNK